VTCPPRLPSCPALGADALSQRALGATRSRDWIAALPELIEHLQEREPAARTETARAQAGLGRPSRTRLRPVVTRCAPNASSPGSYVSLGG